MSCPAVPIGDDATVSAAMAAIDCQVNAGIATAYERLFAHGGAFGVGLTAVLTIYVALAAFGLMTGRTNLSLRAMAPKVAVICLVLTLTTSWQAYQVVVHGLLSRGPDQIAAAIMGAQGGAAQAFTARLDALFTHVLEAARSIAALDQAPAENLRTANQLIWFSALTLLLSTIGLLVASRIILALLLAIGPVFVVLALFDKTRGLFEAWLRTTISFALAPMLIVLGGGAVMGAIGPLIAAIVDDPAGSVENLRPVVMLFLGAMVYAAILAAAAWAAISLTMGWRFRSAAESAPAAAANMSNLAAQPVSVSARVEQDRTSAVVAAVVRDRTPLSSPSNVLALPPRSNATAARPADRRRIGLGQSFRKGAR